MTRSKIEAFLRAAERYCAWFEMLPSLDDGHSERNLAWREGKRVRFLVAEFFACGAQLS